MDELNVFTDAPLSADALELLREGITPHRLLLPATPASSVLAAPVPDAKFPLADLAMGQPSLDCVRGSARLRWLQVSSAGFTRYDTPDFREHAARQGLVVTNSSSVYADACAEHAMAFLLAQSRQLPRALASRAQNGSPEWLGLRAASRPLRGSTVLILGFGSIGRRLTELLAPYGVRVLASRRRPRGDEGVETVRPEELPAALAAADHVINILPENAESRGLVDASFLAAMKAGAVFHNIGRGSTVDQEALAAALASGHLAAAWLDVTDPEPLPDDHPLRALECCHISPHTAGGHGDESISLVRHFLRNFHRLLAGEELADRVI